MDLKENEDMNYFFVSSKVKTTNTEERKLRSYRLRNQAKLFCDDQSDVLNFWISFFLLNNPLFYSGHPERLSYENTLIAFIAIFQ